VERFAEIVEQKFALNGIFVQSLGHIVKQNES